MATILAVDDDRSAQVTLRDLLENLGHEVHLAASAEAALRVAAYGVPLDLAVVATRTHGPSAGEVAARLARARPTLRVLVTGDDAAALAAAARECGAAGVLPRPLDARVVEGELARALAPAAPAAPRPATPAPLPLRSGGAGPPVVLVAEDNDILRAAMLKVLRGAGLEVIAAESGEHAVRAAASSARVDLLVTDVVMPGMTGTELAERLAHERPALKVLFVSGYPSDAEVALAGRRSAAGVLQKPFRHSTLLEHVQRLLA